VRCDPPLAHGAVLNGLWRAARGSRLPHGLAFEGPSGIGKFLTARRLALGLLCAEGPGDPCGACGPCKRVTSGDRRGNHPDLHVVDPIAEEEETIKVERIAEREGGAESVESFLGLRALEGGWRIVLVRDAQRMTPGAQNALLKTLEEPGDATLLVLVTHRPERLLDTIKSRCVRMRFARLGKDDTARLVRAGGVDARAAGRLARLCAGSPGDALGLAARGGVELDRILADVVAGRLDPLVAARAAGEVAGELRGGTPRAKERDRARLILDLALGIATDAGRLAAGIPPAELAHGDALDDRAASRRPPLARTAAEALLVARADVDRNLAPAAVVERCMLVLAGGAPVPSPARG
jgi:DNA polymerase-3 subunit delta'